MDPIIIPILIFSIPLVAILSGTYLKAKKLKGSTLTDEERQQIREVLAENKKLQSRVENLETIVAEVDLDLLKIGSTSGSDRQISNTKKSQQ
jgi:phage shock protein B